MWEDFVMEQDPSKPKIEVEEIQNQIKSTEQTLEDIKFNINRVKDELEFLRNRIENLTLFGEIQMSDKELEEYQDDQEIFGKERVSTNYNPEDLENIRKQIFETLEKIGLYLKRFNDLHYNHENLEDIRQELINLEKDYNSLLSSIPKEQQN